MAVAATPVVFGFGVDALWIIDPPLTEQQLETAGTQVNSQATGEGGPFNVNGHSYVKGGITLLLSAANLSWRPVQGMASAGEADSAIVGCIQAGGLTGRVMATTSLKGPFTISAAYTATGGANVARMDITVGGTIVAEGNWTDNGATPNTGGTMGWVVTYSYTGTDTVAVGISSVASEQNCRLYQVVVTQAVE